MMLTSTNNLINELLEYYSPIELLLELEKKLPDFSRAIRLTLSLKKTPSTPLITALGEYDDYNLILHIAKHSKYLRDTLKEIEDNTSFGDAADIISVEDRNKL